MVAESIDVSNDAAQPKAPQAALVSRLRASVVWLSKHWPELSMVLFGVVVRLLAQHSHPPQFGYDFPEHAADVDWWTQHFSLPPLLLSRGAYHPQLFYVLAGITKRLGGDWVTVQSISVLAGCLRLGLVWYACHRFLPRQRALTLLVLALSAVMPASVQLDTMVTQEALSNLLSVAFIIALVHFSGQPVSKRRRAAVMLGAITALSLLTKISALVLLGTLLAAPFFECLQRRAVHLRTVLDIARPWALAAGIALLGSGWLFVYNQVKYGKAFLDGWHMRPTADTIAAAAHNKPVLDRRTLGYFVGFTTDVVTFPYFPSGLEPQPRFWSVLIASSFVDYQSYKFAPERDVGASVRARGTLVGGRATELARGSVLGGILIALATVLGAAVAIPRMLAHREIARPLALGVPALAVLGQMSFATKFPYDFEGVVKGIYFHFSTLPLYFLFAATVVWLWRRPLLRPVAGIFALSILLPAAYTLYCVT